MRLSVRRIVCITISAGIILSVFFCLLFLRSDLYNYVQSQRFNTLISSEVDYMVRDKLHFSNYVYSGFDEFTHGSLGTYDELRQQPVHELCQTFFADFDMKHPDWEFRKFNQEYDKSVTDKDRFFNLVYKKLNVPAKTSDRSRADNATLYAHYVKKVQETKDAEQAMADYSTILRIYGKCFFDNKLESDKDIHFFDKFSSKLFPFILNIPKFERHDGTSLNTFPIFDENGEFKSEAPGIQRGNSIDYIRKYSNGRGIVISAGRKHVTDLVKLIRVLRALNNKLPIQIVYMDDIPRNSISSVIRIARAEKEELLTSLSTNLGMRPNMDLLRDNILQSDFPKQDIWFVNAQRAVSKRFATFSGYSSKLIALNLNSFEDVLLLDADSVPLIPPSEFFETEEYKKSSTLFFKDRTLRDYNDFIETNFFTKLFPTSSTSMDGLFNISLVTDKTLGNSYLTGWRHFQEAGIVAINKKKHILGSLLTLPLAAWDNPVSSSVWGDKELYWIGFAMAGDENYEFNENAAASVGVISEKEHKYYSNSKTHELCSSHPGHVDKNGRLLWINSGFKYCKKNRHYRDKKYFPFSIFGDEKLSKLYNLPLNLSHAIVPPDLPKLRDLGSPIDLTKERKFKESWKKRKLDIDEEDKTTATTSFTSQLTDRNPQKGWVKSSMCSNYQYCAFDLIDGYDDNKEEKGKFYAFDSERVKEYNYLGDIWITGTKYAGN